VAQNANLSFKNTFPYISVIDEATSSHRLQIWHAAGVCQGPSSNPTRRKSGCVPGLRELPKIWGFPYTISATAEASDFKFGTHLGFVKARKITPIGKTGSGLGLGELPKILGSPIIFLRRLGLATSKLAHSWGLPRPTIKPHPEEKWALPWARDRNPQIIWVPL